MAVDTFTPIVYLSILVTAMVFALSPLKILLARNAPHLPILFSSATKQSNAPCCTDSILSAKIGNSLVSL